MPTTPITDVLYRMHARLTDTVPIGVRPEGLRVDNAFEGTITSGALEGAVVRGVDYYLIRPDGTGVVDAREVIIPRPDGLAVAARARGYVHPAPGTQMPPLEALLDPSFPWPDEPWRIEVVQTFETGHPELQHLNATAVTHLGWVNYATRELQIEARLVRDRMPATVGG